MLEAKPQSIVVDFGYALRYHLRLRFRNGFGLKLRKERLEPLHVSALTKCCRAERLVSSGRYDSFVCGACDHDVQPLSFKAGPNLYEDMERMWLAYWEPSDEEMLGAILAASTAASCLNSLTAFMNQPDLWDQGSVGDRAIAYIRADLARH